MKWGKWEKEHSGKTKAEDPGCNELDTLKYQKEDQCSCTTHRAARLQVDLQTGLLCRDGRWFLCWEVSSVPRGAEAQLTFILRCRSKIAFSWGNSEFSGLWSQPISSTTKLPCTHPDGEFKEVSYEVRIWNRLNQNVSEEKVRDVLVNLPALPTWKNTSNPVLSNAPVHFSIVLGWRKGLWGLWKLALSI